MLRLKLFSFYPTLKLTVKSIKTTYKQSAFRKNFDKFRRTPYLWFYLTPIYFLIGCGYEWLCIHMKINNITFYSSYKKKVFEERYSKYRLIQSSDGQKDSYAQVSRLLRQYFAEEGKKL